MTSGIYATDDDRRFFEAAAAMAGKTFEQLHPCRVDLPDGTHIRFTNVWQAAKSAVHWRQSVWDEAHSVGYTNAECLRIVSTNGGI